MQYLIILKVSEVESRTQGSRPRTQKKFEAKNSPSEDRNAGGQGHSRKCSKKSYQKHFSGDFQKSLKNFLGEKGFKKIFFRRSPIAENKKRSSQIFR